MSCELWMVYEIRWDEKASLRQDAVRSQVIDVLKAQTKNETGNDWVVGKQEVTRAANC